MKLMKLTRRNGRSIYINVESIIKFLRLDKGDRIIDERDNQVIIKEPYTVITYNNIKDVSTEKVLETPEDIIRRSNIDLI